MPRPMQALSLVALALIGAGCTMLTGMIGSPAADSGGCSPQVAQGYRIQTEIPVGILEIRVLDASGSAQASVSVTATRLVPTGLRCPAAISVPTDATGVARLERMKTGPYDVRLSDDAATASAEVVADQTARVTLTRP